MGATIYPRRSRGGPAPLPGYRQQLRADPAAFGASAAQGVKQAANILGQIADEERQRQDAARFNDATVRAKTARFEIEKRYRQMQGKDALGASEDVVGEYAKALETIEADLGLEGQKERFRQWRANDHLQFRAGVSSHAASEGDRLAQDSFKASLVLADHQVAAALEITDPAIRDNAMSTARTDKLAAVNEYVRGHGVNTDTAEALRLEATTSLHASALDAMLTGDQWGMAKKYLAETRGEIDGKVLARIDKGLNAAGLRQRSRDATDEIVRTVLSGQESGDSFNMGEAIEAAGTIEDADEYDAVVQRLEQHYRRSETIRRQGDSEALDRLGVRLHETHGRIDKSGVDWESLSKKSQHALLDHQRAFRMQGKQAQSQTDQVAYNTYLSLDRADQLDTPIDEWASKASPVMRSRLKALKKKLENKTGVGLSDFKLLANEWADAADYIGEASSGKGKDRKVFLGILNARYVKWEADNPGKLPMKEESDRWLAEAMAKVPQEQWRISKWLEREPDTEESWRATRRNRMKELKAKQAKKAVETGIDPKREPDPTLRWPLGPPMVNDTLEIPVDAKQEIIDQWNAAGKKGVIPYDVLINFYNLQQAKGATP